MNRIMPETEKNQQQRRGTGYKSAPQTATSVLPTTADGIEALHSLHCGRPSTVRANKSTFLSMLLHFTAYMIGLLITPVCTI